MKTRGQVTLRIAFGVAVLLFTVAGPLGVFQASGAQVQRRGLELADPAASAVTTYRLFFTGNSTGNIGSIRLQLCTNDPFYETPCTVPSGLDATGAILTAQSGMTGFTIDPSSTANDILLTRPLAPGTTVPASYTFRNITNPDATGALYGRIMTYSSTDGTGSAVDYGGLAVRIEPSVVSIQTEVPPYLLFCVGITFTARIWESATGDYIDFGVLAPNKTGTGQTQMVVATNAADGFIIAVQGSTMTSGVNVIEPLISPDASRKGVSQFGLNLRANSTPAVGANPTGYGLSAVVTAKYNQADYFSFNSGDVIVQATEPDVAKYVISYITNVSSTQSPGIYVSTLQYIATASF